MILVNEWLTMAVATVACSLRVRFGGGVWFLSLWRVWTRVRARRGFRLDCDLHHTAGDRVMTGSSPHGDRADNRLAAAAIRRQKRRSGWV
jgi:hypothetical protein